MVDRTAALDISLIHDLARRLAVPLVLHGSSGVPDAALAAAVRAGMVKINIGTILNVVFTRAVRERLATGRGIVDPRKYLAPARDAVATRSTDPDRLSHDAIAADTRQAIISTARSSPRSNLGAHALSRHTKERT